MEVLGSLEGLKLRSASTRFEAQGLGGLISLHDSRRVDSRQTKDQNWASGRRNSSPEHAIYPQGARKKVLKSKTDFCAFSIRCDLGVLAGF